MPPSQLRKKHKMANPSQNWPSKIPANESSWVMGMAGDIIGMAEMQPEWKKTIAVASCRTSCACLSGAISRRSGRSRLPELPFLASDCLHTIAWVMQWMQDDRNGWGGGGRCRNSWLVWGAPPPFWPIPRKTSQRSEREVDWRICSNLEGVLTKWWDVVWRRVYENRGRGRWVNQVK